MRGIRAAASPAAHTSHSPTETAERNSVARGSRAAASDGPMTPAAAARPQASAQRPTAGQGLGSVAPGGRADAGRGQAPGFTGEDLRIRDVAWLFHSSATRDRCRSCDDRAEPGATDRCRGNAEWQTIASCRCPWGWPRRSAACPTATRGRPSTSSCATSTACPPRPSLPARSRAEGMIAQAACGVQGVSPAPTTARWTSTSSALDPEAPLTDPGLRLRQLRRPAGLPDRGGRPSGAHQGVAHRAGHLRGGPARGGRAGRAGLPRVGGGGRAPGPGPGAVRQRSGARRPSWWPSSTSPA